MTRRPNCASVLIPSSITTIMGMSNPKSGTRKLRTSNTFSQASHEGEEGRRHLSREHEDHELLCQSALTDGQVIVDNFSGCIPAVIIGSPNPDIFVIPNDRSFQRTLADPLTFHAHYILDVDPRYNGALTAPNISYPSLWSTGAGFSKLVHTFSAGGICDEFRLFKVVRHPALQG